MTAVEGIRKLGFRRWYERRLLESHMYLVTCFQHTLRLAEESTCRACGVYARFNVMASGVGTHYAVAGDERDNEWARVKCRKCGHEWTLG